MKLSLTGRQKLRQQVERVLHVPGNYQGGILEMALVLDGRFSEEETRETAAEIARTLKQQSEVFRNVRLNLVEWKPGKKVTAVVTPMSLLMLGSFAEGYEPVQGVLYADDLLEYLKLFQARSKLILVASSGEVLLRDRDICSRALKPFLGRKMIWISGEYSLELEDFLKSERCSLLEI